MRALGPVEEVEEEPLGRSCVGVRELAAVRAGDVVRAAGRGGEPREPVLVVGDGVLRREDDEVARREPDPEVARAPVAELLGRDLVDDARRAPARGRRSRRVEPESTTTTSTGSSTAWRAIPSRQRTRSAPPSLTGMTTEITGRATSRNWYAKSEGRRPATAWATRSTAGVPIAGTGAVWSSSTTRYPAPSTVSTSVSRVKRCVWVRSRIPRSV